MYSPEELTNIVDALDGRAEGGEDFYFLVGNHWAASKIKMARKSLTLVRVGPVTIKSLRAAK